MSFGPRETLRNGRGWRPTWPGIALRGIVRLVLVASLLSSIGCGGPTVQDTSQAMPQERSDEEGDMQLRDVEAACGQCQFGLPGDGCDLAVRIGGAAYFVEGTGIDDHGDAHASDGLCNTVRRAVAVGDLVDDIFVASRIELLPLP